MMVPVIPSQCHGAWRCISTVSSLDRLQAVLCWQVYSHSKLRPLDGDENGVSGQLAGLNPGA
eukprot:845376-Karenia_brevis.AAC.1